MKNLVLFPNFYEGSSFDELFTSCKKSAVEIPNEISVKTSGKNSNQTYEKQSNMLDAENDIISLYKNIRLILEQKDLEKLLLGDFFMPGLDIVQYHKEISKKNIKIGALLHGGSFLEGDLYQWDWLKTAEQVWTKIYDIIYVPSQFLFDQLPDAMKEKAEVLPWGLAHIKFPNSLPFKRKIYDVIFPHRLDSDKGIEDLLEITTNLPHVNFVITSPTNLNQDDNHVHQLQKKDNVQLVTVHSNKEHLQTLSQSKLLLSTAKQENFGFSVAKGVLCGCVPVLPNTLVYPELYPADFLYNSCDEAQSFINKTLTDETYRSKLQQGLIATKMQLHQYSMKNILTHFFE